MMASVKDIYEIVADSWDRICGGPQRKRRSLSEYLEEIAALLREVRLKFEKREVPREEAKKLAILINDAATLASAFTTKDQGLAEVFDRQLPRVGVLMRDADFFIDKRARYYLHQSFDTDNPNFPYWAEAKIREACEELQRAAGTVSAYAIKFVQEAKRSQPLKK